MSEENIILFLVFCTRDGTRATSDTRVTRRNIVLTKSWLSNHKLAHIFMITI